MFSCLKITVVSVVTERSMGRAILQRFICLFQMKQSAAGFLLWSTSFASCNMPPSIISERAGFGIKDRRVGWTRCLHSRAYPQPRNGSTSLSHATQVPYPCRSKRPDRHGPKDVRQATVADGPKRATPDFLPSDKVRANVSRS